MSGVRTSLATGADSACRRRDRGCRARQAQVAAAPSRGRACARSAGRRDLGGGRSAAPRGLSARRADRRRARRFRDRRGDRGRARATSTSPAGTSRRTSSSCAARAAPARSARCSPRRRSASTSGCWSGPGRRCRCFTRRAARCARPSTQLTRRTRIRCETDPREHPFHCHHEKTMVIDGEVAFVGGIDMTDFAGDRFDTSEHPARRQLGWHDVGTRLRGPAVLDVARSLRAALARAHRRAARAAGRCPTPPASSTVQVVRTVAEDMYDAVPNGEFRILESYVRALRSAPSASSTSRTSSCGRRRSSRCWPTSCAGRRATTSGS